MVSRLRSVNASGAEGGSTSVMRRIAAWCERWTRFRRRRHIAMKTMIPAMMTATNATRIPAMVPDERLCDDDVVTCDEVAEPVASADEVDVVEEKAGSLSELRVVVDELAEDELLDDILAVAMSTKRRARVGLRRGVGGQR